jgi:hypothetical protein
MIEALRISLLVVALALVAGAIWSAKVDAIGDALTQFFLAVTCGIFERIAAAVWQHRSGGGNAGNHAGNDTEGRQE